MTKNEEIVNIFWYHVCLAMNHRSAFSSPSSQETESMRAKESIKKNTEMNRKQQLSFHLFVLNIHKNFFILKENSCISKSTYMAQNLITIEGLKICRELVVRYRKVRVIVHDNFETPNLSGLSNSHRPLKIARATTSLIVPNRKQPEF